MGHPYLDDAMLSLKIADRPKTWIELSQSLPIPDLPEAYAYFQKALTELELRGVAQRVRRRSGGDLWSLLPAQVPAE